MTDNMDSFGQTKKETVHVNFEKFVNMTMLQFNCMYRTMNEINKKVDLIILKDLSGSNYKKEDIIAINEEMRRVHEECSNKFSALSKTASSVVKSNNAKN
jgi:low affinity Fe/Cu permease